MRERNTRFLHQTPLKKAHKWIKTFKVLFSMKVDMYKL